MAITPTYDSSLNKTMPSEVYPRLYGDENQPGLFKLYTNDIVSLVTSGGSALMRWLPARGVNTWNDPIAHLSWIAPEGFDGSQTYADHLIAQGEVEECEFGDGYTYQICEYNHRMYRVTGSTRSEPIKQENLGMRLYERLPQQTLRGETRGMTLTNDRDWSLARLGLGMEEHQNWNIIYGNKGGIPNTYDGLNVIINNGWVKSKKEGYGSCDFTDPIVMSGVGLSNTAAVIRRVRAMVQKLLKRMSDRNFTPSGDDMVILMNDTMWHYIKEALATGTFESFYVPSNATMNLTPEGVEAARQRISSGGFGFGTFPVYGINIPVLPDTRIGANSTLGGIPYVTGDVYVLTKRFRGLTVLEHQYLDWSQLGSRPLPELSRLANGEFQPDFFQGNMMKVSVLPLDGAYNCWYYGAEMYGRIVSYMNMLQGRLMDVSIAVDLTGEHESASFTSPNFYPYGTADGGAGNSLLTPLM